MKNLETIQTTINGTEVSIKNIGQTQTFGYLVTFSEDGRILGEAVIMEGEELCDTIQETGFYDIAALIYDRLK